MIQLQDVIAEVRKIASERPNNYYVPKYSTTCSYISGSCKDGSIGCLFGQAIKNINPQSLELMSPQSTIINMVRYGWGEVFEPRRAFDSEMLWCNLVQSRNDISMQWKKCIEEADNIIQGV